MVNFINIIHFAFVMIIFQIGVQFENSVAFAKEDDSEENEKEKLPVVNGIVGFNRTEHENRTRMTVINGSKWDVFVRFLQIQGIVLVYIGFLCYKYK